MSNWHDRHRTPYDREHEEELRHEESRPGEKGYLDHRLDAPLSTALDVAVLVKTMADPRDGAALINRYVDAERARIRLEAVAAGANA